MAVPGANAASCSQEYTRRREKAMEQSFLLDGRSVDQIMKGEGIYMTTHRARSDKLKEGKPPGRRGTREHRQSATTREYGKGKV